MLTIPTFVIGLGGVGNAVVRLLQERFLTTETGGVPESVFLRSIDTASETNQATSAAYLPTDRYTKLGGFNAAQVVTHLDKYPLVGRWWHYKGVLPGFIDDGAGARRPVGRLCFFQQFSKVHDALQADFRAAISVDMLNKLSRKGLGDDVARTPRVFIVGSLAGGTCSGMFIDTAILARELLIRSGYIPAGIRIAGMFAMPSVVHLASRDAETVSGRQRRINAFGALRELDFIMSRKDALEVQYPDPIGRVATNDALFNMTMLFTDTKHGGSAFGNQSDVLIRAAHALYAQIARGTRENLNTVMDNVKDFLDPSQQHTLDGKPATYCTFGVEWLEIPRHHLLKTWCGEIATGVGKAVGDFEFDQTRPVSLDGLVQKRLPEDFKAYSVAFRLRAAAADDLSTLPELSAFSQLMTDISTAEKPADLTKALERFDLEAATMAQAAARACGRLPDSAAEQEWLNKLVDDLISSADFRIGGAKRVMRHLSEKLDLLGKPAPAPMMSRADVERECKTGLLKNKVDSTQAMNWARARMSQVVFEQLRATFGDQAARLSQQCTLRAERLAHLQDLVRQEAADLEPARLTGGLDTPPDMWLIEPEAINQAVQTNLAEVKTEVAQIVALALGKHAAENFRGVVGAPSDDATRTLIRRLIVEAVELVAVRKTKRPSDTTQRLQRRMTACSPLVHMADDEIELINVMGRKRRPVPIRMVVTGMEQEERQTLNAWATAEKERAGRDSAFQVIASDDPLRDDVLNVEIGWPLCLMREVKTCARVFESVRNEDPNQAAFTLTMKELPGLEFHDFMPRDAGRIQDMFAVAWVLDAVKIDVLENTIRFAADTFGPTEIVRLSQDEAVDRTQLLRKALEWFRRDELMPKFEKYFAASQDSGRTAFREKVSAAVVGKRENIAKLRDRQELSMLLGELSVYCDRVEKLAKDIVDL